MKYFVKGSVLFIFYFLFHTSFSQITVTTFDLGEIIIPVYEKQMQKGIPATLKSCAFINTEIKKYNDSLKNKPFTYELIKFDSSASLHTNFIKTPTLDKAIAPQIIDSIIIAECRDEMRKIGLKNIYTELQKQEANSYRQAKATFLQTFDAFIKITDSTNGIGTNSAEIQSLFDFSSGSDMYSEAGMKKMTETISKQQTINSFIVERNNYLNALKLPYTKTDSLFLQIIKWQLLDNIADAMESYEHSSQKWMLTFITSHYLETTEYPSKIDYIPTNPELFSQVSVICEAIKNNDLNIIKEHIIPREIFEKRIPNQNYDSTLKALYKGLIEVKNQFKKVTLSSSNTEIRTIISEHQAKTKTYFFIYSFNNQLFDVYLLITTKKGSFLIKYKDVYGPDENKFYIIYPPTFIKLK